MVPVIVTELEYRKAEATFVAAARDGIRCIPAPPAEDDLAAAIRVNIARHAIVGVEAYKGPLYDALPRGGVIARFGVGHDGISKETGTTRGLFCTNTPGALDASVAEHAIALLLAAARHLTALAPAVRAGTWSPAVGSELSGKTLAVIGCGPIGRRVAQIASRGLGMRVIGCEIASVDAAKLQQEHGFAEIVPSFEDAVRGADFVTLHIPSTPATRHFINPTRLASMASTAWLVNTARGAVVDEVALFDAVAGGRIGGAALDVFEVEPYKPMAPEKDLRTLDRVILTPHVGSSTREACTRMAERALANIRLAEAGQWDRMDLLNPDVLKQ